MRTMDEQELMNLVRKLSNERAVAAKAQEAIYTKRKAVVAELKKILECVFANANFRWEDLGGCGDAVQPLQKKVFAIRPSLFDRSNMQAFFELAVVPEYCATAAVIWDETEGIQVCFLQRPEYFFLKTTAHYEQMVNYVTKVLYGIFPTPAGYTQWRLENEAKSAKE